MSLQQPTCPGFAGVNTQRGGSGQMLTFRVICIIMNLPAEARRESFYPTGRR
jgi:hypothetical protein